MPAELKAIRFAPVPLTYLAAAVRHGLPLPALLLWGFLRQSMPAPEVPASLYESRGRKQHRANLADEFGVDERTVRRWLGLLKGRGWLVWRRGWPSQYWALLPGEKPDTHVRIPTTKADANVRFLGQKRTRASASTARKRTPTSGHNKRSKRKRKGETLPYHLDAGGNGQARLVEFAEGACGRSLSAAQEKAFATSLAEARDAGATDRLVANCIVAGKDGAAVWCGPNEARVAARRLLASYQQTVQLPEERRRLDDILRDVQFAREFLARPACGEDPQGRGHNTRVLAWAGEHEADLTAAATWPSIRGVMS